MKNRENINVPEAYKGLIAESAEDLYEHAPCGYFSTLPDGTIVKINQTMLKWLGYDQDEILYQKKFQDLLPIGGKIYHDTHYGPLLQMQGFVDEINFDLVCKDKHQLPVLVNTIQLKDEAGKPLLNRTNVFNITTRKKYEQELLRAKKQAEQATKVKAEFLSTISHEIRTPLNSIISIANLFQDTKLSEQQATFLNVLQLSANNLLSLINDVLDFSKIEAGKMTLESKNFNLRELIYTVLYGINISGEEKGLEINAHLDEKLPFTVVGDPVKIGQVLTNLLGNAVKFTEKGAVTLNVLVQNLTEEWVDIKFSVKDTGIGIPEDKIWKIFEEFTQGSYEVNQKYGGTGLGLTISNRILAMLGSELAVKSKVGDGSEFTFTLHLKIGQNTSPEANLEIESDKAAPSVQEVKLLLAEDNEINVFVIGQYLKKWGVVFDVAPDGEQAVEKVMQNNYDLVLMDLRMPVLNGFDAVRKIRLLEGIKYQQLPIIALSAASQDCSQEKIALAGINDKMNKPFNPQELYNKIVKYTKASGAHAQKGGSNQTHTKKLQKQIKAGTTFNLNTFEELTENNPQELQELIRVTIKDFENYKNEFKNALITRSKKDFDFNAHKITMTLGLLEARNLKEAIEKSKKLLEKESIATDKLELAISEITQELSSVILGLKEALSKRNFKS